jgi:hypothetical protein
MARFGNAWNGNGVPSGPQFASGRPNGVTLHHQAGNGDPRQVYIDRRVSAHFWIRRDGWTVQHVDTSVQSWHAMNQNPWTIGVETEGCAAPPHNEPLTAAQIEAFAQLMAWANRTHGVPLVLAGRVGDPGLGFHNMPGFSGSTACPCDVRRNARQQILNRAAVILQPPPPPPPPPRPLPNGLEPTMNLVFGSDRKACVGLPAGVTHVRLSSMTARIAVQWPGATEPTRSFDLTSNRRADVPVPASQQGLVIIFQETGEPVYLSWIAPIR